MKHRGFDRGVGLPEGDSDALFSVPNSLASFPSPSQGGSPYYFPIPPGSTVLTLHPNPSDRPRWIFARKTCPGLIDVVLYVNEL